jgi:F-type H+-transporting ATPase subunit b
MTVFLASGGGLLSFNTGFAIWVLISMIIFIWGMGKYAVPHIVKALDDREKRIKESLESAELALAKAEKISRENDKALREAEIKAQQIRKEAIEEAELLRTERIDKSKQEAAKILEDAKSTIEKEKQRALIELRNEVAELAVKAATIIIDSELDKEKNKKIVEKYISNLSKN